MGRRLSVVGEPLRLPPEDRARNIIHLVHRSVERFGEQRSHSWRTSRRAARAQGGDAGWRHQTFRELWEWVERVALAFDTWGVRPGDRVAIYSRSRPEWLVCDLAIMSLGAVTCPIYHAEHESRVAFVLANTDARFAIVESPLLAKRVAGLGAQLRLEKIAVLDATDDLPPNATTLDALTGGVTVDSAWRVRWREGWNRLTRDDIATIVHTSGATGQPKGALLSHGNVVAECEEAEQAMPFGSTDQALSTLPLSHMAERAGGQFVPLAVGAGITFAEPVMERWLSNLAEVRPTIMLSVPPFFARVYRGIRDRVDSGPAWKRAAFAWATGLGRKRYANHVAGRRDSPWLRLQLTLANRLVFRPIKQRLGGRLRFFLSGAAPLPPAIGELFYAMDVLILEGYGMTETTAAACINRPDDFRFGSVGKPFPETEVRIEPETGEILIRGPIVFKGYVNMPDETAEAIDADGWLHTGDVGSLDEDGRLMITDRIKNLIVLANGKKVMPGPMENALAASPYITQSVILGDGHEQTGVLVVPDFEHVKAWATEHGSADGDMAELAADGQVNALMEGEVRRLLTAFAAYERPRRVAILPRELTEEADELTPVRKPKRRVIVDHFPEHVARLFEGERTEATA